MYFTFPFHVILSLSIPEKVHRFLTSFVVMLTLAKGHWFPPGLVGIFR